MTTTYHHDPQAFTRNVMTAEFMVEEMRRRAANVLADAEARAPYDAADHDGDHYRDDFSMEAGVEDDHAYGRVLNHNSVALFVEYGTRNNVAHRTLGHALDAAAD